jgi:hypothetical protein
MYDVIGSDIVYDPPHGGGVANIGSMNVGVTRYLIEERLMHYAVHLVAPLGQQLANVSPRKTRGPSD